MSTENMFAL